MLMGGVNKLQEFAQAKQRAQAEGLAFEQADALERGQPDAQTAPTTSADDELLKMSEFLRQSDEITANTKRVDGLAHELEKLHKTALTAASTDESGDASAKIDVITAKINTLSNQNRAMLKSIELENSQLKELAAPGSGGMRMRESKFRALAAAFLKVTQSLQRMQQLYRDKYRQQIERQYRIVNPRATVEEIKAVAEDTEGAQAKIFASAVKEDARKTLSQMKDRFSDVKTIEKSIMELHQLFLDLQTIVVEQGDIINRVDFNVETTVEYTDVAASDMKAAVGYQKSIWKKKWILMILAIVLLVIFLCFILYLIRPLFYRQPY